MFSKLWNRLASWRLREYGPTAVLPGDFVRTANGDVRQGIVGAHVYTSRQYCGDADRGQTSLALMFLLLNIYIVTEASEARLNAGDAVLLPVVGSRTPWTSGPVSDHLQALLAADDVRAVSSPSLSFLSIISLSTP